MSDKEYTLARVVDFFYNYFLNEDAECDCICHDASEVLEIVMQYIGKQ